MFSCTDERNAQILIQVLKAHGIYLGAIVLWVNYIMMLEGIMCLQKIRVRVVYL